MKKIDSMNVVPFIDIMLVLLVIVLMSASFVHTSRLRVNIPQVGEGASTQSAESKPLYITIDELGRYYINDKPYTLSALKSELARYDADTQIIINGDAQSNLNAFVQMMDILQAQGLQHLYIVVEEK